MSWGGRGARSEALARPRMGWPVIPDRAKQAGGAAVNEMYVLFGFLGILGVLTICLVPIIGGFLQAHRERQWTHLERMKALEMGQEWPDDAAAARIKAAFGQASGSDNDRGALARKCFSTAIWVAFWGFIAASSSAGVGFGSGVAQTIAASVGAVGVTAVICGTILASRVPVTVQSASATKPQTDADAYDVVAGRG